MSEPCPICRASAETRSEPETLSILARCESCGVIKISREAVSELERDGVRRAGVAGVLRERTIAGATGIVTISRESAAALAQHAPRRVSETLDRTLLNIARLTKRPGEKYRASSRTDHPLAFAASESEYIYVLRSLHGMGYFTGDINELSLSPQGWARVEELEATRPLGETAFVAMSFDRTLDGAYESGIKLAIEDAGWTPLHVGKHEHAGKIDDLILLEIQRARLVVADFTQHRQSVYFEAGYALGLGKLVIWTCRHDDSKSLHFDTRQYNHILWHDEADLRKRLGDRIRLLAPSPRAH